MSEQAAPEAPKKKGKLLWIILVLVLLLAGGGGAAAWFFLNGEPAEEQASDEPLPPPTIYFELRPAFVANLIGGRFLQVELDLMVHDQAVIDAVIRHNPAVRNDILLLLGSQKPADIESLEGKLAVQQATADAINAILAERETDLKVEEVYFSSFVMQ